MKKLLLVLLTVTAILGLTACDKEQNTPDDPVVTKNKATVFKGIKNASITIGDEFDPLEGILALDSEDGDITSQIKVEGNVDVNTIGNYELTYKITDSANETTTATRTVVVNDVDLVYPTGFKNYKFATTELRHTFMAAAEKYLLNNMYAGVPLFANGSFNLYHERLQLPVDEFVPVMGFGTAFGTMSMDDSHVLMDDGEYGNEGEYTYRTTITTNPVTFNPWLYDTSTDSTIIGQFTDSLYFYEFNEDKTGYLVSPSMASENPIPVDSNITETGKEVSKVWRIKLRDDLMWTYHEDTDISNFAEGHEVIDANDFMYTFELALTEQWFRAISGGGDFLNEATAVKNAQEFVDGEVTFDEVGINKIDDLTFEFEFVNEMSEWNVKYWLSSFVMTPINEDLYNEIGDQYGTTPDTVAYNGAYVLDYYEPDKVLRYSKNPNFHSPDTYFYTGYTYMIIEDQDVRFQEFIAGKTEGVGLPTTKYEEYKSHPGLKQVPGPTTFRIMINGTGTEEKQKEQFPDSTWIPEPILANQDFKMAMFHAVDRQKLAEEVLKTSTTNMYLFTDAYLVDAELGVPYRQTEQGKTVGDGLSPSTFGYNYDAAKAYWELAIDKMVEDGIYEPGTEDEPTEIVLTYNIFSGSEGQALMGAYIKTAFEDVFQSDEHHIKVIIEPLPTDFPGIYYDYMMVGEFDISIGGISGSRLDAASFLDTYTSDNRGGFTLNWGIDTSIAEIEVVFEDFEGNRHREMWSFDAIASVLNGEVYVVDGEEAEVPAAKDFEYTPTTVTFTIDKFSSPSYKDITYTVENWSTEAGGYVLVEGLVDVVPDSETVTVEGLTPGGDYQITINFTYTEDETKTGKSVAPWFLLPTE